MTQANAQYEWLKGLTEYCTPKTITVGAAALATAIGLNWFTTPDKTKLTLKDLNPRTIRPTTDTATKKPEKVTDIKAYLSKPTISTAIFQNKDEKQAYEIRKNVALNNNDKNVCIAVGGFLHSIAYIKCANGGHFGYLLLKSAITNSPCVTFDSVNDTRAGYSFGGEQDLHNLDALIKDVVAKKPDARISLVGSCKGSTAILNYLAKKAENKEEKDLKNIASVVLESPPISLDHTIRKQPLYSLSHYFFRFVFPNYNHKAPTILNATAFPKDIPILIGGLKDDTTAPHDDIVAINQQLKGLKNNNVSLYTREKSNKDIFHGRLYKDPEFQKAAREFINKHSAK